MLLQPTARFIAAFLAFCLALEPAAAEFSTIRTPAGLEARPLAASYISQEALAAQYAASAWYGSSHSSSHVSTVFKGLGAASLIVGGGLYFSGQSAEVLKFATVESLNLIGL